MIFNYILLVPDSHHRRFSVSLGYNLLSSSTSLKYLIYFFIIRVLSQIRQGVKPLFTGKVSMDLSIVSQREIHVDTESYVTALRASLRQSPDVILLGEMRDYETMQAVISQQLVPSIDEKMIPVFEIMTVTPAIRNMIRDNKIPQLEGIISSSAGGEIISMDSSLLTLYKEGQITAETALAYATNPELLKRKM